MSLGRRQCERQDTFWVTTEKLGSGPRNVFFDRLNRLLAEIDFDRKLEKAAKPYYQKTGRKGLPPGVYFRMIFIGYFEDISSQRGIAWRCDDSRSLARFLGYAPGERTPDHSTLSLTRERLPMEFHAMVFELLLAAAQDSGLLKGKTMGVDATDLEANASMKSIVRRDSGDDWREYVRKLYEAETGVSDPDDEELRRFDKGRKDKKVSNENWVSKTDPDGAHRQDERWPHASEIQGGKRGRLGDRDHRGGGSVSRRLCRYTDYRRHGSRRTDTPQRSRDRLRNRGGRCRQGLSQ